MEYDLNYEIFRYADKETDKYEKIQEILDRNEVSIDEVKRNIDNFRCKFNMLTEKYGIGRKNIVQTCYDTIIKIENDPDNKELQYIYFCLATDFGIINEINSSDWTKEQKIRNYLRQNDRINELLDFLSIQSENSEKLNTLRKHLKKAVYSKNIECSEELELICQIIQQHDFFNENTENNILRDNLNALLIHIESDEMLNAAKPYIVYAVLTRKTGMMQKRENFFPNIKSVFQYQIYNIYSNNGKNFNNYQSCIEFYDHLRRIYADEKNIDMDFCDFCFANLSPLSEWYYAYCQPDFEIPMIISRKVYQLKPMNFPMLFCYEDYSGCDLNEFEHKNHKLYHKWEKLVSDDLTDEFLECLYNGSDISEIAGKLPRYDEFSRYAELFLFANAEQLLQCRMLDISQSFIRI